MKNIIPFIAFMLFQITCSCQATAWSVSVPANTLTEAGTNYTTNMTSSASQTILSLSTVFGGTYTITAHKIETAWNANLSIWLLRTGNGTGSPGGTILGGTTYLQLSNSPQTFFYGTMGAGTNRNNVPIQYQIRGLSVVVPVKTHTVTVVYTITN